MTGNFIISSFNKMTKLVAIVLLIYLINECQAVHQCKSVNPITKFEHKFDCPPNKPLCCDDNTSKARCCSRRNHEFVNIGLTILGVASMVFAAILCAGCGGKKEEAAAVEAAVPTPSQAPEQESPSTIDAKRPEMKSQLNSKIDKKPQSTVEMASAISALDSKAATSSFGSTIESRTSNIASRTSGTGSSIGSKIASSAIDSKASSVSSSLDSKGSSIAGSTIGQSNIGSSMASKSAVGSQIGSRLESRGSSVSPSKSGMDSSLGSSIKGSKVSNTGSNIEGSKVSGTGSSISSKLSKT